MLLTVLFPGLLSLLSYATQDHLLRRGTALRGLDPPTSILNQESALYSLLIGSLIEVFSQCKFLFLGNPSSVKLTKLTCTGCIPMT